MADFEELKLTVNLVDNASAGLTNIRTQLTGLTQTAGQVQGAFTGVATSVQQVGNAAQQAAPRVSSQEKALKELSRSAEETTRGMMQMALAARRGTEAFPELALGLREAATGLGGVNAAMGELGAASRLMVVGLTGVTLAVVGIAAAMTAYGISVFKFGREMYQLSQTARSLGMTFGSLKSITDQNAAFGISVENTTAQLGRMQSALADLSVSGSQLRQQMLGMGIPAQRIDDITRETDAVKRQNMIRSDQIKIFEDLQKRMGREAAREWANRYARMWGADPTAMDRKPLEPPTKEETEALKKIEDSSRVIGEHWASISRKIADIKDAFLAWGLPGVESAVKYIDEHFTSILDTVGKIAVALAKLTPPYWLYKFGGWVLGGGGSPAPEAAPGAGAPTPPASGSTETWSHSILRHLWGSPGSGARPDIPSVLDDMKNNNRVEQYLKHKSSFSGANDNISPLIHRASFGGVEGFGSDVGGSADEGRAQGIIKSGVYEALIEFYMYVRTGGTGSGAGGAGGRGGVQMASFGGNAGAAAAGGGGGDAAASFGSPAFPNLGGGPNAAGRAGLPSGSDVGPGTGAGAGESPAGPVMGGQAPQAYGGGNLAAQRAPLMDEVNKDPATRRLLHQMMKTEGGGASTVEALFNRTAMIRQKVPGYSIKDELNSGFYGPIKSGAAQQTAISTAEAQQFDKTLADVAGGSNTIQGRTNQGMASDPGAALPGRVAVPGSREVYNFWEGRRKGVDFSTRDSAKFAAGVAAGESGGESGGGGGGGGGDAGGVARSYERRRGEPGEFNAAESGIFGRPGQNLTTITLKNGKKVQVNTAGAERFRGLFNDMIDRGYKINDIGGFSYRGKAGGGGLSEHAWGTAVDVNPGRNAFRGRTTDMPKDIEQLAWSHGVSWGGRFGDPMHFELMSPEAAANKRKILEASGYANDNTKAAEAIDRPALDRPALSRAQEINSKGSLNVDVKAPAGSKVDYTGSNLLAPTSMQRQTQMMPTDSGPSVADTARSFMRGGG